MRTVLGGLFRARRAIAVYGALILGGWAISVALHNQVFPEMRPQNEPMIHRFVMGALVAYVVMAAIPFVPGAEIGFALLLVFGGQAAPLVYAGMIGALLLSYGTARLVPAETVSKALRWLHVERAAQLILDLNAVSPQQRLGLVEDLIPARFTSGLLRNRYILLALALNIPGNSLIGGGGGLAFIAGVSGLFAFWPFLLVILCAVAPVPLVFLLS
ncbi:MAG: hypothetical protein QNI90_17820 [Dinoroseobacter sp.]|nr:hypothetical protein [Dinoroseobacter sp.]